MFQTTLRSGIRLAGGVLCAMLWAGPARPLVSLGAPPNFVVILCDNLGYGDVGCYGSRKHRTPNIDR
ncbi:MAG TPA: arylsulfatase, partial [Planctomycetaceae bacterium]|nr:arylsulfatase [Planctomycetaceae bacterium]